MFSRGLPGAPGAVRGPPYTMQRVRGAPLSSGSGTHPARNTPALNMPPHNMGPPRITLVWHNVSAQNMPTVVAAAPAARHRFSRVHSVFAAGHIYGWIVFAAGTPRQNIPSHNMEQSHIVSAWYSISVRNMRPLVRGHSCAPAPLRYAGSSTLDASTAMASVCSYQ
jgi:hypothetical protein